MSSEDSMSLPQYSSTSELAEAMPQPISTQVSVASMAPASMAAPSMAVTSPPAVVGPQEIEMLPSDAQIAQAIEQLAVGDFHGRWDYAKQFSRQFSHWGDRVIPALIHQLQTQQDPDTQWFLVRILSQFEHPAIVPVLAQLLVTTQSEELQIEVSKAISALGEIAIDTLSKLLTAPVSEGPSTPDLVSDLGPDSAPDVQRVSQRMLAARTLAHIRRSAIIEPLLSITADPNPELRAIAVEALGSFHDARITPVLLAALQDSSTVCRIEAIRTLGRRRDLLPTTDLVTPLQQCLLAADESVACESAIALGRLGTESAIAALSQQLRSPLSTPVKVAIVQALGWLNTPTSVACLVDAFEVPAPMIMPAVRKAIAQSLGQTRDLANSSVNKVAQSGPSLKAIAVKPLISWLSAAQVNTADDLVTATPPRLENFLLAQTVLSSLARLGVPDTLDSLIPILSNPDPRLRMHALSALKQIDPRTAQAQAQQYLHHPALSPTQRQNVTAALAAW